MKFINCFLGQIVGLLLQDNITKQAAESVKETKDAIVRQTVRNPLSPHEHKEKLRHHAREMKKHEHEMKHERMHQEKKHRHEHKASEHMKKDHAKHAER